MLKRAQERKVGGISDFDPALLATTIEVGDTGPTFPLIDNFRQTAGVTVNGP